MYIVISGNSFEEVRIETANSGAVDYRTLNISNYYTSLSTFQIFPAYRRSLKFRIKTCAAAFILLSGAINLQSPEFYEICITSYRDNRIFLRRIRHNIKRQFVFKGFDDVLSCEEHRMFELNWGLSDWIILRSEKDGILVNWTDTSPIDIQGVGIMTGWGAGGTWIVEHFSLFNGQYCGVNGTYGDMTLLSITTKPSELSCALGCESLQDCMGINMNRKTGECHFVARGQHVVKSVDLDWTFYTKCFN
ncbi:unnamed protein product [Mytilus coruscus]|uniref:Farnesoic acid O-methyl transferase domain-containing protein n=1 Tax=Mytilus coruscus TaxID=42192 RepID=A0A6J8F186_MYTCO|nr:unnamed protein product [Mytilus coruscus]